VIKRDTLDVPLPAANVTKPTPKDVSFIDAVASSVAPSQAIGFVMPPRDADGPVTKAGAPPIRFQQDAPSCSDCGSIMVRNGACYKCLNCGSTNGFVRPPAYG
jgi:hypothetical protein